MNMIKKIEKIGHKYYGKVYSKLEMHQCPILLTPHDLVKSTYLSNPLYDYKRGKKTAINKWRA